MMGRSTSSGVQDSGVLLNATHQKNFICPFFFPHQPINMNVMWLTQTKTRRVPSRLYLLLLSRILQHGVCNLDTASKSPGKSPEHLQLCHFPWYYTCVLYYLATNTCHLCSTRSTRIHLSAPLQLEVLKPSRFILTNCFRTPLCVDSLNNPSLGTIQIAALGNVTV